MPAQLILDRGDSMVLLCCFRVPYVSPEELRVMWQKLNESDAEPMIDIERGYAWFLSNHHLQLLMCIEPPHMCAHLMMHQLSTLDSGHYQCLVRRAYSFDYVTYTLQVSEHQPHLAFYIANKSPNNNLAYNSTSTDDLRESRGGMTSCPLASVVK